MRQNYIMMMAAVFCTAMFGQLPLTEHTLKLDDSLQLIDASIADFSWMTGRWEGKGFGGVVEETWNPPLGGTMVGTFRHIKDNSPGFYEFLSLVPHENTIVYKVKHFNPDLVGWEDKEKTVDFPLVKVCRDTAYFEGLTIMRNGNRLTHYLAFKQKDGSFHETTLTYSKRNLPTPEALKSIREKLSDIEEVPLLILGSYHMSNPGQDMFNLEADDVLVPKRQIEIQAIVNRLAQWKPTKVAVEAPFGDSATIARYQAYLRGERELRKSEEEQIGFRLAKQLGHSTIYPIDVQMRLNDKGIQKVIESDPAKYGAYLNEIQILGKTAMSMMGKWLQEGTIGSMLYQMNIEELNDIGHSGYFRTFVPIVREQDYAGADFVNTWYQRNLRIFSNLHKISDRPDDRIFIVYGAGHVPLLQRFAEDSPYFRVENILDYLRGL